ncbi:MAG TPA: DUF2147 domain-containing protein [Terricaulis sp.]|nr:DUF2147 domain-containing protein [Terricaulis sp.]
MNRLIGAALVFFAIAAPAQANDFLGVWRTEVRGGLVRLEPCGDAICGAIVSSPLLEANPDQRDVRNSDPALRTRALRGLRILQARRLSATRLGDGWVYDPEEGETYSGEITLLPDGRLRLRGCIVWPLCRSQIWVRDASM